MVSGDRDAMTSERSSSMFRKVRWRSRHMLRSVKSSNGWQDPEGYEALSWKLGTPRGEHVRQRRLRAVLGLLKRNESLLDVGAGPASVNKDFRCRVVVLYHSRRRRKRAKQRADDVI